MVGSQITKKKVAYYIGSLNRGGSESLVLDVCRNHANAPFDICCIYRTEGFLSEQYKSSGVRCVKIPKGKLFLKHILQLRQFLKNEHIDVVHAQTSLCAILSIIATTFTKTKVVTSFHGLAFSDSKRALQKFIFRHSSALVFVSNHTLDTYKTKCSFLPLEKCYVVYNGVSFNRIQVKKFDTANTGELKLGMVGSFRFIRNQLFVCKFLKKLLDEGVCFHFYFIGARCNGEENRYDDCVAFCRNNGLEDSVSFLGGCDNVPQLLSSLDAYIYATYFDTFGLSIIEAIASGLPTFVNDWPVAYEVTHNGDYAYIYKSNDVDDLFEKFSAYLNNKQRYAQCAIKNAHLVRQEFSIETHIDNLNKIYLA